MTVTAERAKTMLFTEGYLNTDYQFVIKKDSPDITKLEDLKGKTIAVNRGSIYDTWARDNMGKYGFQVENFNTTPDAVQAVLSGRAFANVAGNTAAAWAVQKIFRAGIESVGSGQSEAARSTGLTRAQTLAYVVVPQAVRNVLLDLIGNTPEVVKLTSLGSVVALPELLYAARSAQSITYNPSPIVLAAAMYFVLLWPGVRVLSRLERRMLVSRR
jgi:ABC-type amino acid transport system permease subunit